MHTIHLDTDIPEQRTEYVTCEHCGTMHHVDDGCTTITCPAVIARRFEATADMVRASDNGEVMRDLGPHAQRMLEQMVEVPSMQRAFRVFVRDLACGVLVARVDDFFGNVTITIEEASPEELDAPVIANSGERAQAVLATLAEQGVGVEQDGRGVVVSVRPSRPVTMWLADEDAEVEAPRLELVPPPEPEDYDASDFGDVRSACADGDVTRALLAVGDIQHKPLRYAARAYAAQVLDLVPCPGCRGRGSTEGVDHYGRRVSADCGLCESWGVVRRVVAQEVA